MLAGGQGSRLGKLTLSTPKCLVPIAGRPLLDYWLEQLDGSSAVTKVFINVYHLGEQVQLFLRTCQYAQKVEVIVENRLWGTGGTTARLVARHGPFDEGLFVAHADNLSVFSFKDFWASHQSRHELCLATVMTFETDTPSSCGIFKLNEQNVVIEFYEKVPQPPGRLANGAVFAFSNQALNELCRQFGGLKNLYGQAEEVFDLSRDFLPRLVGRLWAFHNDVYHRDIGTPDALAAANVDFLDVRTKFLTGRTEI